MACHLDHVRPPLHLLKARDGGLSTPSRFCPHFRQKRESSAYSFPQFGQLGTTCATWLLSLKQAASLGAAFGGCQVEVGKACICCST
mmetsp:Transcript_15650/g.26643  ORF Transcript_15650/g.26643 Transcript_15650/m.26643 type:complete len:87 (-) Transcript_15650:471-731(-)